MRKKRLILWLLLFLLVPLAAFTTWLFTADLGVFEGPIERAVSAQLGREFAVDGDLHIDLGRTIDVSASQLRLANPAWATSPDLGTIKHLTARVDLMSLLDGLVVIESLVIDGMTVNTELSADGEGNWLFERPAGPATGPTGTAVGVIFAQIEVRDLTGRIQTPGMDQPLVAHIESFRQDRLPDDMLEITTIGNLGDAPIEYRGRLGPFRSLLNGRDLSYEGQGRVGNMRFDAVGHMDFLAAPKYPTFEIRIEGPDFREAAGKLGLRDTPEGPYQVHAVAARRGRGLGVDLQATIGDMNIEVEGNSSSITDYTRLEYTVSARGPDLGGLTRLIRAGNWPREPFELEGGLYREGKRLEIEDIELSVAGTRFFLDGTLNNFPNLSNAEAQLNISGPDAAKFRELAGFKGVAEGEFEIQLLLDARAEGADRLQGKARTSLGTVDIEGTLGDGPSYAGSQFRVGLEGHDARMLMDGYGIPGFPPEPFKLGATFQVAEDGLQIEEGAQITLEDDTAGVSGFISFAPGGRGTDVRVRAGGDDLAQFAPLAGSDWPIPHQPYQLDSGFRITDAGFQVDGLQGSVGPNRLSLDGLVTRDAGLAGTDLTFRLSGPDLETLIRDTAGFDVPGDAFESSGRIRHLNDALRLESFILDVGPLSARANLEAHLPFDGSRASFTISASGPDFNVIVPELPYYQPPAQPFDLRARGSVRNGTWTVEEASFDLGDARLAMNGVFDDVPDFSDTDFNFDFDVPTPGGLGILTGIPIPRLPIDVSAHFSGTAKQFLLDDLDAQWSGTDMAGSMVADFAGPVPSIRFESYSQVLDWTDFYEHLGELSALNVGESDVAPDARLIPDFTFPLDEMSRVNVSLLMDADVLRTPKQNLREFELRAVLSDGALTVERFHGAGISGYAQGSISMVPREGGIADVAVEAELAGLKLDLSRTEGADPENLPVVDVSFKAGGYGPGLREVAASLNGHLNANSTPGVIPNSALGFLDKGVIEQAFSAILPKTEASRTTRVQCFAARLQIMDGVVRASPGVALVTDKVQIVSKGRIDLANEKLDMTFQANPTKAYQANVSEVLLNPFVKISGTLAKPQLTLDAPRALLHTGAAIGTGGLSILAKGLFDRMRGAGDPCAQFMQEEEE